ncbi:Selenocysteine lyase/Cysteine desulfurase [Halogranum amylolyticum]|uniref:Selenocysteine lyase/Cysteine desulfurase n=1 Tax=Halogranum amylolyticum TaxID=660520 RepID=A0A1H8UQW4_9EURY|nr:aminotransferase class V-fold PLP-dependent enzyme [Halogranum amylolyticum]SEP05592.1 Selenocysteine lyase/Cysteine desulfurase [Halogranum amylolyticum]
MTPTELRADMPALEDVTYLNTGASGPSPRHVVEAAESFLEYHEFESPAGEGMYPAAFDTYDDVRATVADFLGADTEEIALTQSTSDGINRIAGALEWEAGDVVVRTDFEHPAGILPWQRLERTHDVEVRVVESSGGRLDLDAYREAVEDAKLVCFSSLTWNYGTRMPVEKLVDIAHEAGAYVLVDAVQSVGQTPVDVHEWGADAVAAAGHKWLLGTWGAGYLYVDASFAEELHPRALGYRGVVTPTDEEYELKSGAARLEIGTTNPAPYVALQQAIETMGDVGLDTVESRIHGLASSLSDAVPDDHLLSPTTPESGLVTIDVADPEGTVERLKEQEIVIRPLPEPDAVRVSVHAFNTEDDVQSVLEALNGEY